MSQFEREIDDLEQRYASGEIPLDQFNREMRELQRDYRAAAEEAADDAYRNAFDDWY